MWEVNLNNGAWVTQHRSLTDALNFLAEYYGASVSIDTDNLYKAFNLQSAILENGHFESVNWKVKRLSPSWVTLVRSKDWKMFASGAAAMLTVAHLFIGEPIKAVIDAAIALFFLLK